MGNIYTRSELKHLIQIHVENPQHQVHGCPFPITRIIIITFIARFSCQRQGASADKLHVKAAKFLPLVGLTIFKQDPIYRGHDAQYLYRPPPAGARIALPKLSFRVSCTALYVLHVPSVRISSPLTYTASCRPWESDLPWQSEWRTNLLWIGC